jgi:hypothetical protein
VNNPPGEMAKAVIVEGSLCLLGSVPEPGHIVIAGTPAGHKTLQRLSGSASIAPACPATTGLIIRNTPIGR